MALALTVLAVVTAAEGIGARASGAWRAPATQAARAIIVRDEGHLLFISSSGSQLLDQGQASGTVPGSVRVEFTYDGSPAVKARFTIYGRGGSIRGQASGTLNNPVNPSPSFRGALSITGGTGRYAHARGSGEMFGVFYRRSYALTVQTIGKLRY